MMTLPNSLGTSSTWPTSTRRCSGPTSRLHSTVRSRWNASTNGTARSSAWAVRDISSIPPKKILEYFPRLAQIADKVLYGSDWPAPGVKSK